MSENAQLGSDQQAAISGQLSTYQPKVHKIDTPLKLAECLKIIDKIKKILEQKQVIIYKSREDGSNLLKNIIIKRGLL